MSGEHAILAPSSAPRWAGQCPGSVALEAAYPEVEQSEEAREGDAAHWAAATLLRALAALTAYRETPPTYAMAWPAFKTGLVAPNGVVLTDEMIEAVEMFVGDVVEICGSDALDKLHVEEKVQAVKTISAHNWGTPDVFWFALGATGAYVFIHDSKYGHRFVDAFENWQLINYAACVLERPEFEGVPKENIKVVLSIVQPRSFHPSGPIRRWKTTAAELQSWFSKLRIAGEVATTPGSPTIVGPECRDCRGRHACEALQRAADTVMDVAGLAVPVELPPAALGAQYRMLMRSQELLKSRITGLTEQVKNLLVKGTSIPFVSLEQGKGRERWTKPVEEVLALGSIMGVDLAKPVQPITPAQARAAGLDAALVDPFTERPKGELKVAVVDDATARKVFGK